MKLACFYHCWAGGAWHEATVEHLAALESSAFDAPVFLGIVGSEPERWQVQWLWKQMGYPATVAATANAGYEQPTINALRRYATENGGAVLYAHTKGAYAQTESNANWRRAMTRRVVSRWRENLTLLEHGAQAVGCHWLTHAKYWRMGVESPFFAGNFWIARCDYLRTLPECPSATRYDAERWVGSGNPRLVDLAPGWPNEIHWPEQRRSTA
jgi:hypothetical protein